ncbi:MAG TPA: pyridoxamine 5'-phosphate oxidase [Woeseiaceae bacterium]|nr:pyridoxamine 5'-phosphate oxidase [Woeseiaceae bacterium]
MEETRSFERLPESLPADPLHWVEAWLGEAVARGITRNPNAMTLATVAANGAPSARVVLCKHFVPDPGYLVFFTNYRSRKARELEHNARAAACFHWDALGRQVRIEGPTVRSPAEESDAYFATRPWGSQLGAWASDQSTPLASRAALVGQVRQRAAELGLALGADTATLAAGTQPPAIPRPPHWGGIRLWVESVELWVEGADRLHDRAVFRRELAPRDAHSFTATDWTGSRLQP